MKTLYKKDSKNKIRILRVFTKGHLLYQESGLLDGKLVTNIRECKAKNIGRANETTADEQSILQMEALITKKLKEGYFETLEEAKSHTSLMPMLANKFNEKTIEFHCYVQPKLDGVRMVGTNKNKLSRKNREVTTVEHIDLSFLTDEDILDGELYCHGMTFQEIISRVKKYQENETEKIKYYVYDMPSIKGTFSERYDELYNLCIYKNNIEIVPTYKVNSLDELKGWHKQFLSQGYEGTIVRTDNTHYEFNKRSKSLLKYKDFIDETYEIVDVIPNEADTTQGTVICKINDTTFKCNMKVSIDERKEILKNKNEYIGQLAEVRFFEFTDGGIPRFPVYHGIRIDK